MKIRLLSISQKPPAWITAGFEEYAKRLPASCSLELIEIPAEKRGVNVDIKRIIEREGEKLLAAIKPTHYVIALHIKGMMWSTEELANQFKSWQEEGRPVDLIIGGPDGLSTSCLQKAKQQWSLSPLTFPHLFVRIIIAEQIYRAWSLLNQHPYHRA